MSADQLGKDIRKAREKAKLTQVEVAKKAEIHVNYYARIERGEVMPRYDIVKRVCKVLGIKLPL